MHLMLELLALVVVAVAMGLGPTFLIILGVMLAMIAWIVVVAPLQYFLYLICGGPARTFKGTVWSDESLPKGSLGFVERIPVAAASQASSAREAVPAETPRVWHTVYGTRPVTFTTSVAALVLWITNQLI